MICLGQQVIAKKKRNLKRIHCFFSKTAAQKFLFCGINSHLQYFHHGNHDCCQINHKGKGHEIEATNSQTPNTLFCPLRSSCTNPSHSTNSRNVEIYCSVSTWLDLCASFVTNFLRFLGHLTVTFKDGV